VIGTQGGGKPEIRSHGRIFVGISGFQKIKIRNTGSLEDKELGPLHLEF
jgi:hypothetical protein